MHLFLVSTTSPLQLHRSLNTKVRELAIDQNYCPKDIPTGASKMIKSQNYFYNYDTNLQFTAKLYNKIHKTIITKCQAFKRLLKKLSKKVDWLLK